MTRTTVTLLFSKDTSKEPPGILQCDTSGEYYPHCFNDWRHAIHYIRWRLTQNIGKNEHNVFREWCKTYGYYEYEEFTGDLNEIKTNDDSWIIFTSIGTITSEMDLNVLSAWTFESPDLDSD